MTRDTFQIVGESLAGHGLSFDVLVMGVARQDATSDKLIGLVEAANVIYKQGRESALLSHDDRFDLHCAVDVLRALAVVVGPTPTGDRYRRCSDILARLLHDQQQGGS